MKRVAVLYIAGSDGGKADLYSFLADHGQIDKEVELPATTFFISYTSKKNKSIFKDDVARRIKSASSV